MATRMNVSIRYSTHLPVLMECMKRTTGDVLELGPGVFSTPILHWMCKTKNRQILTIESNQNWLDFCQKYYRTDNHKFMFVSQWSEAIEKISKPWDVALVDLSPDVDRKEMIKVLANNAKYIIVHDADDAQEKHYQLSTIKSLFKYYWRFEDVEPATAVYSNLVDLSDFKIYE